LVIILRDIRKLNEMSTNNQSENKFHKSKCEPKTLNRLSNYFYHRKVKPLAYTYFFSFFIATPPLGTVHYHFPLPKFLCIQVRLKIVAVSFDLDCFALCFCKTTILRQFTYANAEKENRQNWLPNENFVCATGRQTCKYICLFTNVSTK